MTDQVQFGIRLTADGAAYIGTVQVASARTTEFGQAARKAGDEAAAGFGKVTQSANAAKKALDEVGAASASGIRKGADEAQRAATNISGAMNSLRSTILSTFTVGAVMAGVRSFINDMIEAQKQTDKFRSGFAFAFGGLREGAKEFEYVRQTSNRLGQELNSTATSYLQLSAASKGTSMEGAKTRQVFEAIVSAGTVLGLSQQEVEGSMRAVQQMMSKGTVQSEELRGQLGERLPGAFQIAARSMGVTTQKLGDMLEKGEVMAVDFLPRFAAELQKSFGADALKAADNLQGRINRLANSMSALKQGIADAGIGQAIGSQFTIISERIDAVTESLNRAKAAKEGFLGQMFAAGNEVAGQWTRGAMAPPTTANTMLRMNSDAQGAATDEIKRLYASMDFMEKEGRRGQIAAIQQTIEKLNEEIIARQLIIDKIKGAKKAEDERKAGPTDPGANTFEAFMESSGARKDVAQKWIKSSGLVPDTDKYKEVTNTLYKLRLEGSISAAELKKYLAEADKDLNKSLRTSLAQRVATMEQSNNLTLAFYQTQRKLEEDALQREEQRLEASFQARLISESAYLERRTNTERASAQARLAAVNAEIESTEQLDTKVRGERPRDAGEKQQQETKLLEIERKLVDLNGQRTRGERDLADVAIRSRERQYALDVKLFDYEVRITNQVAQYLKAQKEQTEEDRFQLSLIGQSEQAQAAATAERRIRLEAEKEINKLLAERALLEATDDPAKFMAIDNAILRIKQNMPVAAASARDMAAALVEAGTNAGIMQSAVRSVSDIIQEGISRLKENWRSATRYVRDQILENIWKTLYQLTVQKWILNVGALITGGFAQSFAGNAAGSAGGNAVGGLAGSAASSYLGSTGVGAYAGGMYAGATSVASELAIGSSFVGPSATLAGGAVGVGAELYAALASIGPYGWIAIAVIAIAAWLAGSHKGGPKVGGSSFIGFNPDGTASGTEAVPGTDNGRFFTPNQADNVVSRLVKDTSAGFYSMYSALGGTNPQGYKFGLGFDHDPQGTAQSRVSSAVYDASGKEIYRNVDRSMDDKEVPAALKLESSRQILAALQNSDLHETVLKVLKTIDVKTASQDAIDSAMQLAAAFSGMLALGKRDYVADADQAYKVAQGGARGALQAQGAALIELANKFDGSAAKTQELAQAQLAYRNSLVQLLVQIRQMRDEMKDMFAATREKIVRAGMNDQETYNWLRTQADHARDMMLAATDPASAQRWAAKANDYFNQAFDLLSPDQQRAQRPEFLTYLDRLEQQSDTKLAALAAAIAAEAKAPFDIVATKLGEAADKLLEAALELRGAASSIDDAAGRVGARPGGNDVVVIVDNGSGGTANYEAGVT